MPKVSKKSARLAARIESIRKRAERFKCKSVLPGFYIEDHESRESESDYCSKCAGLEIATMTNPESCRTRYLDEFNHYDLQPRCERCGEYLGGFLTDYGAEEELNYREEQGFDFRLGRDCYDWCQVENQFTEGDEQWERLMKLTQ